MSRHGLIRATMTSNSPRARGRAGWLAIGGGLALAGLCGLRSPEARAQEVAAAEPASAPPPAAVNVMPGASAGVASTTATSPAPGSLLPPEVQLIHFRVPEGVTIEVLGPQPEPLPPGESRPGALFGFRVGVGYRLRLSNLPQREGVQLYPVVEVVGHLHRPTEVDAFKFPIRVSINEGDLEEAADRGRLVTHVVYLEDPDQALPITLPKDQIPVVNLTPAEEPLHVASALGRAMAIMRLGRRVPNPDEWANGSADVVLAANACPFSTPAGGACGLPLGFACGTAPPRGQVWLPRDEYLCDGGDRGEPIHFGGDGGLRGIDPRDAVIKFQASFRARVLPTNMVCMYAPRFAAVRSSVGPNEALLVEVPRGAEITEKEVTEQAMAVPKRLTQNQTAEANAHRARAAGLVSRTLPFEYGEIRILQGYDVVMHLAGHIRNEHFESVRSREKVAGTQSRNGPLVIKTAESAVMTGIIQGAGEQAMAWKPQEIAGVELRRAQPGMAVIKHVSTDVAEPGDTVTFSLQYRNMGNVPIGSVTIVDSLMPRLEYVKGSAVGPAGTVFTAADNRAGSTELRWDLPGFIAPGAEGYVSFKAIVR